MSRALAMTSPKNSSTDADMTFEVSALMHSEEKPIRIGWQGRHLKYVTTRATQSVRLRSKQAIVIVLYIDVHAIISS